MEPADIRPIRTTRSKTSKSPQQDQIGNAFGSLRRPSNMSQLQDQGAAVTNQAGLPPTTPLNKHSNDNSMIRRTGPCQKSWEIFAEVITCCIPNICLNKLFGKKDKSTQHAWREKTALCLIAISVCAFLAFFTFFLRDVSCAHSSSTISISSSDMSKDQVAIYGNVYDLSKLQSNKELGSFLSVASASYAGKDMSALFINNDLSPCESVIDIRKSYKTCQTKNTCFQWSQIGPLLQDSKVGALSWNWSLVESGDAGALGVFNGRVLNLDEALQNKAPFTSEQLAAVAEMVRHDGTMYLAKKSQKNLGDCLASLYNIGRVDNQDIECIVANAVLNIALVIISSLVIIRFILAAFFAWFLSWQLGKIEESRAIVAAGTQPRQVVTATTHPQSFSLFTKVSFVNMYKDLYTVCLVTCYSEGEEGLRSTLESLTQTDYNDQYKIILVVADGVVKGSGNSKPTGEIVLEMMDVDETYHGPITTEYKVDMDTGEQKRIRHYRNAEPMCYNSIGVGSKSKNMAKVYCGTFSSNGKSAPIILVYKCGCPCEVDSPKPGNRGKRDSQIILMDFMSKIMFDEYLSPLQYDMFTKWTYIMTSRNGFSKRVTPDMFEVVLMVDADTKINSDSLSRMIAVMQRDPTVMGLCGETRIMNKNDSWVTMIQVFEYYVSHHLAKAFESIFGGVTCLPGCFCMYRLKTPKPISQSQRDAFHEDDTMWIPILNNPDIVLDYSESTVDTLHKKNLLLLGEDRYLTTLMLRTFPKRKMMFVPKAICKTQVPNEFKVLLSQRRRWINSTIHNLMELVLVPGLCGVFCFSMQFVILLELMGTITLPAAIIFTGILIISAFIGPSVPWVPLGLLFGILGLPAILIFFTTGKYHYFLYMAAYLMALPVWNFILPTYAFWHFDDFSWGQTRQVAGEKKGDDQHGTGNNQEQSEQFQSKRWADWERIRRRALQLANIADPLGYVAPVENPQLPPKTSKKRRSIGAQSMLGIKIAPIGNIESAQGTPRLRSAVQPWNIPADTQSQTQLDNSLRDYSIASNTRRKSSGMRPASMYDSLSRPITAPSSQEPQQPQQKLSPTRKRNSFFRENANDEDTHSSKPLPNVPLSARLTSPEAAPQLRQRTQQRPVSMLYQNTSSINDNDQDLLDDYILPDND